MASAPSAKSLTSFDVEIVCHASRVSDHPSGPARHPNA